MPRHLGLAATVLVCLASLLTPTPAQAAEPAYNAGWGMTTPVNARRVTQCTDGFHGINKHGTAVVITAGHCGQIGDVWTAERGGQILGTMRQRRFVRGGSEDDYAIIRSAGNHWLGPRLVDRGKVKYVARLGVPKRGRWVCSTGRTSGTRCGKITRVQRNGIIVTTIISDHGDSGGPLYSRIPGTNKVAALGVLSYGDTSSYTAFQRLSEVLNKTGIRLRTR